MKYDIIIIGGGIIGLSTAMQIKEISPKLKVALLEKEADIAKHQTGNNSGVIHAGVYYKPGSLKAINCRDGYNQLLSFCNKEDIKYDLCGKLIVATNKEELPRLEMLYERSIQNGLDQVKNLNADSIRDYEPHATGIAALWVPYTGIIDYTEVSRKYMEIFTQRLGGEVFLKKEVKTIINRSGFSEITTGDGIFQSTLIVNTAGLFSDQIARLTSPKLGIRIIPFRGEYFMLKKDKSYLVRNLIYPVPDPQFPFLGVHFTRRIHGGIEAGPNAVWAFKREGYKKTDFEFGEFLGALGWKGFRKVMRQYWQMGLGEYYRSFNKYALVKALQKLIPEVSIADIETGGSGVRAQACDKFGGLVDDFLIVENPYIINVLNAPSPAATASLAIGKSIAKKAIARFQ